jgi:hypothetical protein
MRAKDTVLESLRAIKAEIFSSDSFRFKREIAAKN